MLEYLPCVVLRQRIPDDHLFWSLEFRDTLALQERKQACDVRPCRTRRHDHRTRPFSGALAGEPDDRDFGDAGMVGEQVLDFLRGDVLTVADNDVLGPA